MASQGTGKKGDWRRARPQFAKLYAFGDLCLVAALGIGLLMPLCGEPAKHHQHHKRNTSYL